jgi:hypothetical protein
LVYRLTVKVRYAGQTPAQAMASNPVRIQHDVSTTSYQVPVTEQLLPDPLDPNYAGHVWQVQALYNGRPYGRNRGLSQIEWFVCVPNPGDTTYRSTEVKGYDATSRKPDTVRVPVLSWTVPYPELLTGRPVKLTGTYPYPDGDTLFYSLHLQMPERIGPDLVAVLMGKGSPSTEPLQVNGMKYRGGYFVYREPQPPKGRRDPVIIDLRSPSDTGAGGSVQWQRPFPGGYYVFGAPSDTGGAGGVQWQRPFPGGYYVFGVPSDTGAGGSVQWDTKYRGGYYVFGVPSDTGAGGQTQATVPPYYSIYIRRPSDTDAGGSVQRKYNYSGYFVYRLPSDTTQPAQLEQIVYYNSVASQIRRGDTCCTGLTGQTSIETRPEVSVGGTFIPQTLGLHLNDVLLIGDFGSEPIGGFAEDDQGSVLPNDPVFLWWGKRPGNTPRLLAVGAIHRDGVRFFWAGKRTARPGTPIELQLKPVALSTQPK